MLLLGELINYCNVAIGAEGTNMSVTLTVFLSVLCGNENYCNVTPFLYLRTKNQPKQKMFWDGHPAGIRGLFARISQPKTSLKILEKEQAFRRGRP